MNAPGITVPHPQLHETALRDLALFRDRVVALEMRQIAGNAGMEGAVVVGKVREGDDSFGFNAATEKYEDLVAAGVIDPAKVTRTALQNAASIAGLMLTTEAMIADVQDEKGEGGGMPGGMGGMGMGM